MRWNALYSILYIAVYTYWNIYDRNYSWMSCTAFFLNWSLIFFLILSSQQFASSPPSFLPLLYSLSGFLFNFLYLTSSTLLSPIPISLPCIFFCNSWHAPLIMNRKPKLAKEVPIGMQPNDQERKRDWRQREGGKKRNSRKLSVKRNTQCCVHSAERL